MPKDQFSESRFIVGIERGTTKSAVAYVDSARGEDATPEPFAVPQLVGPGEVQNRPVLPSFLYLPAGGLFPEGALALPWMTAGPDPGFAVGELARAQGWQVPSRLVSSAKSRLCHARVDRGARILPWPAPAGGDQGSPGDASAPCRQHAP